MDTFVTVVHFITATLMIVLILLQQGKGAEMGASLGGGGSNTVFGSTGGGSFFGKLTAGLAVVFFLTSLGLALFAKNAATVTVDDQIPFLQTVEPESDIPSISVEPESDLPSIQIEPESDLPIIEIDANSADLPDFDAEVDSSAITDVIDDVESPTIEIQVE